MLWAALLPIPIQSGLPIEPEPLSVWALQFTPRVAIIEDAVLLEVEASIRLFGGLQALQELVNLGGQELGAEVAWAPTGLAALALVRQGVTNSVPIPFSRILDKLPLSSIAAVARHQETLSQVGCRTLGQVRALHRGGLARRFDKELLVSLDQAYGLRPETYVWQKIPDSFLARLELMSRVETAPALLFGARRLLLQMVGWLRARRLGATAFTLRWCHDIMRAKDAGTGGELTIRTSVATQNIDHLARLLAEHLAKETLKAPVGDIELLAMEVEPLVEESRSLLPDGQRQGASVDLTLERIQARLGKECIRRPVLREDHRLEWAQAWTTKTAHKREVACQTQQLPLPTWVLDEPLRLAEREHRPVYQGLLQLLLGPDRIEGGWWHRVMSHGEESTYNVQRDYWIALSPTAGVLWVFQARLAGDETAWFLHGHFG